MDDRIEATKAELKKRVIAGEADGITGVGIDRQLEKLIVFYRDHEKAVETLRSSDPGFADFSIMEDGASAEEVDSFGEDLADNEKLPLSPSSVIRSADAGMGRLGCFVKSGPDTAAITSSHIFHVRSPGKDVFVRRSKPNDFVLIGKTLRFPTLLPPPKQVNRADASLFLPDLSKVTLERDPRIRGDFFNSADLGNMEGQLALNLTNHVEGQVLDVTAMIAYDVSAGGSLIRNVVFDQQVLIKNQSADQIFGRKLQSGSLVVKAGRPETGKALGIYAYTTKSRNFHFVTPFFACAAELGIDSILNT